MTASFAQTTIDVPPGASNFRDIGLTLTVAPRSAPGTYPFTVTAASSTDPAVSTTTSGTLTVAAGGVTVSLNPGSGAPGSSFQATVTNTGTTSDTFKLALAGPAAVVANLGSSQVTLDPGATQIVSLSTGAASFALHGSLPLTVSAASVSNPAIESAASASLNVASSQGMTANFKPARQVLASPGMATFVLTVENTGNTQDSYSATIVGANGPVTANLVGLDGAPTQSIPAFILPGLASGAIVLQADLKDIGLGMLMVKVQSLSDPAITMTAVASVSSASSGPHPLDGPEVTQVLRYGYHWMPTIVVVSFNQALDPAAAADAKDYRIIGPGGRIIRVKRAVYNRQAMTVTLYPSQRINIHHKYELIIDGITSHGIRNTYSQLLDGAKSGKPGSDYKTSLTWHNLVIDPKMHKTSHGAAARSPKATATSASAVYPINHGLAMFRRVTKSRR